MILRSLCVPGNRICRARLWKISTRTPDTWGTIHVTRQPGNRRGGRARSLAANKTAHVFFFDAVLRGGFLIDLGMLVSERGEA
jgi:hypothetical protein